MPFLRLTKREYRNTMAELLGDTSGAGSEFEADDTGPGGYLAPSNVATETARQYMTAAEKLAAAAISGGKIAIPCMNPANAAAENTCVTQLITSFGTRAYRRPLVQGEADDLLKLFQDLKTAGFTFTEAVTHMVEAMLQSPNLIYHWELGDQALARDPANNAIVALTPYQLASRLSYLLWESSPDAPLMDAAAAGQLATPEGLKAQATRMLQDESRAGRALYNFHQQWLKMTNLEDIEPATGLGLLLGQEVRTFLSSVFVTGDGTLKSLLTAPYTFANATTAKEYGLTAAGAAFTKVALNPAERLGILMQVPFLRAQGTAPPIYRGLVVYRQLLCGVAPPPQGMVIPEVSPDRPGTTTRERFSEHANLACAVGCHAMFDPWGFSFENFDSLGHYRTTENGKPVDASGLPQADANKTVGGLTPGGKIIPFRNATELVSALGANDEVSWCTSKNWGRYMLGRMEGDADLGGLTNAYVAGAFGPDRATARPFSVRDFLVALVGTKPFRFRAAAAGETL
ncbi:MAG TPA: DUF1592 domain-containing protein [Polyangiaceae bacterium]|jgi:hypothetical protein|nr:DUF1592 domain-containing protein [Polyangiaceae bacterium]